MSGSDSPCPELYLEPIQKQEHSCGFSELMREHGAELKERMARLHQEQTRIVLSNPSGAQQSMTVYGENPDIPDGTGYTHGKIDGSGSSYFIVYKTPNYYSGDNAWQSVIVDSTDGVDFGFPARSVRGFNKDGITLFQHYWYCGTAQNYTYSASDINDVFPAGTVSGASSIIISQGWWSLYTQKDFQGDPVNIDGETKFGPGTGISGFADDKVQSIKCVGI